MSTALTDIVPKGTKNNNQIGTVASAGINLFFIIYSIICVVPMLLIVAVSFSGEKSVVRNGYRFIPTEWSLGAYQFLMKDYGTILHAYGVSLIVTVVGTILSMFVIALYAYPISRPNFPHAKFFTFLVFFTILFSGGLVPFYLTYVRFLDLRNTILSLILPLVMAAFWVLVARTFFSQTIPGPVLESAKIDGAGEMRIFIQIVLPLSLPIMATIALFQTLNYWNDWFLSLIFISNDGNVSVQYLLYKMMANISYLANNPIAAAEIAKAGGMFNFPSETVRMALVIVGVGPIIFAYPFFQKYFVRGLTVGAVKG